MPTTDNDNEKKKSASLYLFLKSTYDITMETLYRLGQLRSAAQTPADIELFDSVEDAILEKPIFTSNSQAIDPNVARGRVMEIEQIVGDAIASAQKKGASKTFLEQVSVITHSFVSYVSQAISKCLKSIESSFKKSYKEQVSSTRTEDDIINPIHGSSSKKL